MRDDAPIRVEPSESGLPLTGFLRRRLPGTPWSVIQRWVREGRVLVGGTPTRRDGRRLRAGDEVLVRAPPERSRPDLPRLVHVDTQVVVIDKPAGLSSVPFEGADRATALALTAAALRRRGAEAGPLHVVHRLDRATSGLLLFARTKRAERHLAAQFRSHSVERSYACVAHGQVEAARIESRLVADRGDGLRGSSQRRDAGRVAITHVVPLGRAPGCTLCRVSLETGKTHQVRIHLSERGHPLLGETVYVRDFLRGGGRLLPSPRLLLHAATLGFVHPLTGAPIAFESALPGDFVSALEGLGRSELLTALEG